MLDAVWRLGLVFGLFFFAILANANRVSVLAEYFLNNMFSGNECSV